MHAASIAVLASQCLAHGADRNTLLMPSENFLSVRFYRGGVPGKLLSGGTRRFGRGLVVHRNERVIWERAGGVKPVLFGRHDPNMRYRAPPNALPTGDASIGFTQSQALDDLSDFVHFEPPVSHCAHPRQNCRRVRNRKSESFYSIILRGSISPRFQWLHCAAIQMAP